MGSLDDAKFTMMLGMLRKLYSPADAQQFAQYLASKGPEDVAFIRDCLRDISAALDNAVPMAVAP